MGFLPVRGPQTYKSAGYKIGFPLKSIPKIYICLIRRAQISGNDLEEKTLANEGLNSYQHSLTYNVSIHVPKNLQAHSTTPIIAKTGFDFFSVRPSARSNVRNIARKISFIMRKMHGRFWV